MNLDDWLAGLRADVADDGAAYAQAVADYDALCQEIDTDPREQQRIRDISDLIDADAALYAEGDVLREIGEVDPDSTPADRADETSSPDMAIEPIADQPTLQPQDWTLAVADASHVIAAHLIAVKPALTCSAIGRHVSSVEVEQFMAYAAATVASHDISAILPAFISWLPSRDRCLVQGQAILATPHRTSEAVLRAQELGSFYRLIAVGRHAEISGDCRLLRISANCNMRLSEWASKMDFRLPEWASGADFLRPPLLAGSGVVRQSGTATARNVMTPATEMPTVFKTMTVDAALEVVLRDDGAGTPVLDGNDLVGVITLGDIGKVIHAVSGGPASDLVGDHMRDPVYVTADTPIDVVRRVIAQDGAGLAVVLTEGGRVAGYVTAAGLSAEASGVPPAEPPGFPLLIRR